MNMKKKYYYIVMAVLIIFIIGMSAYNSKYREYFDSQKPQIFDKIDRITSI
jgi:hypothetical protein